jgi:alpha-ketoglutarate-dependent taurine dioxygenase
MMLFDSRRFTAAALRDAVASAIEERGAAVVTGLDPDSFEAFAARLGRVLPQYDGGKSFAIRHTPEEVATYYSLSKEALPAHTDGHDLDPPPRILVLGCVVQSARADGYTEVSDSRALLHELSAEEEERLASKRVEFFSRPLAGTGVTANTPATTQYFPIWDRQRRVFRFSTTYLHKQAESDPLLATMVTRVAQFHEREKDAIQLSRGDALVLDNRRMLHSRRAFQDDRRHLVRIWIA